MYKMNQQKGKVYISSFQRRKKHPTIQNVTNINVTSGSMNKICGYKANTMSPMFLKTKEGIIFENFWQYGKKFKELGHEDRDKWLEFRNKGYLRKKGDRHPKGTKTNEVKYTINRNGKNINFYRYLTAYSSEYNNEEMDYLTSRLKIYIPLYEQLVKETDAFKELKKMVDSGLSVMILDLDGPLKPMEVTPENINKMKYDTSRPYGHGYVIANLLI